MTKDDLVLFLDGIGRTLLGEKVGDTKTTLEVKNPSVLHVQPNSENGQIQVQLIPVFFKEFAAPDSDGTWNFNKNNITLCKGVQLDDRLVSQYENMYSVVEAPEPVGAGAGDAPVVKLFDD